MIYRLNDSVLVGSTEEVNVSTGNVSEWIVFNFTDASKPELVKGCDYVLSCWSDASCIVNYSYASESSGRYAN